MVTDVNFRTKEKGWRCRLLRARKGDKTSNLKRALDNNEYYNSFLHGYFHRPSCYDCQFKCNHQGYYSDLTIADFWKIGNKIPLKVPNYSKGISAVIVNTEKGKHYFESCAENMEVIERTWNEFAINGGLRSEHKPENNDEAFQYLRSHSWRETQNKYFPLPLKRRIFIIIMLLFGGKCIRKFIKI